MWQHMQAPNEGVVTSPLETCKSSLGKKPYFSTMFSTTSQMSFIARNITFNYKMFYVIQK
jgi:hypothetical protein